MKNCSTAPLRISSFADIETQKKSLEDSLKTQQTNKRVPFNIMSENSSVNRVTNHCSSILFQIKLLNGCNKHWNHNLFSISLYPNIDNTKACLNEKCSNSPAMVKLFSMIDFSLCYKMFNNWLMDYHHHHHLPFATNIVINIYNVGPSVLVVYYFRFFFLFLFI